MGEKLEGGRAGGGGAGGRGEREGDRERGREGGEGRGIIVVDLLWVGAGHNRRRKLATPGPLYPPIINRSLLTLQQ